MGKIRDELERFMDTSLAIQGSTDDVEIIEKDQTKLLDQAEEAIKNIWLTEEEIENILGEIEIPIDTNPMYVEETSNPAIIKLKSKYASIIAHALYEAQTKKLE